MSLSDYKKIAGQPIVLNNTIPPATSGGPNVNQNLKLIRLPIDEEGNLLSLPVFLIGANGNNTVNTIRAGNSDGEQLQSDNTVSVYGPTALNNNALISAGTTFDFARSNNVLANVADVTTATYTGPDIRTYNARSILIYFNVTSFTDTSYTPELDWKDGAGNYQLLWKQNTAKTAAADTVILLGVGATTQIVASGTGLIAYPSVDSATANELIISSFPVPPIIRLKVTKVHAAGAFTGNFQVYGS